MMLRTMVFLMIWGLISAPAMAGVNASAYQKLGAGARALGMGGAFVAVADDATAGYWNPAGLTQVKSMEIGTMYGTLTYDRQYGFVGFAHTPPGLGGSYAVSVIEAGTSGIKGFDDNNNPTKTFSDIASTMLLSYGQRVGRVSAGGSLKLLYHSYTGYQTGMGVGADMGLIYEPLERVTVGATVQNLVGIEKWKNTTDYAPLTASLGVAFRPLKDPSLVLAADAQRSAYKTTLHLGGEYWIIDSIGLRAGYNGGSLTLGASGRFNVAQLDFAYDMGNADNLGDVFRVSLLMNFGPSNSPLSETKPSEAPPVAPVSATPTSVAPAPATPATVAPAPTTPDTGAAAQ